MIIDTSSFNIFIKEQQHSQQLVTSLPDVNLTEMSLLDVLNIYPGLVSGVLCVDKKLHPFQHSIDVEGPPVAFRPRRLSPEKYVS